MNIFIDTETTGVNRSTDRVVQIAWVLADDQGCEHSRASYIIKPEGFVIPLGASAIHGITTERARREGHLLADVLSNFRRAAASAVRVVAHNAGFDVAMLDAECRRVGIAWPLARAEVVCTMLSSVEFCRLPGASLRGGYKRPKLQELHSRLFGCGFENAHDALADVLACMGCYFELVRHGVLGAGAGCSDSGSSSIATTAPGHAVSQDPAALHVIEGYQQEIESLRSEVGRLRVDVQQANDQLVSVESSLQQQLAEAQARIDELKGKIAYLQSPDGLFFLAMEEETDQEWKRLMAHHPRCPDEWIGEILYRFESGDMDEDREILLGLAENPAVSPDRLEEIVSEYAGKDIALAATKNPGATPELLAWIVRMFDWDIQLLGAARSHAAFSEKVFAESIVMTAHDPESEIREAVAAFVHCPQSVLFALSEDPSADVRLAVAKNPNCPLPLLWRLESDDVRVVADAAMNSPSQPLNQLERFLTTGDWDAVLELAKLGDPKIATRVVRSPSCPSEILDLLGTHNLEEIRLAVANHKNCSPEALLQLCRDSSGLVRLAVASSDKAPREALVLLSQSPFREYREAVALNARCPADVRQLLSKDRDRRVARAASRGK